ncbi:SUF system NifU family Fe-S cluster assembly protein [Candidatus Pacearchaeota archaeon]|nr:SUF system NifU family Fe-S cluster assembly protein [Candidatus Pacearchaeota archaeon]
MIETKNLDMYKENILDLYKYPHNFGSLKEATHSYREFNALCGDDLTISLIIKNNKIEDIKFQGTGCAISMAAASMLTDEVKGKSLEEAKNIDKDKILDMLQIPISSVRLKCALLCLDALKGALNKE